MIIELNLCYLNNTNSDSQQNQDASSLNDQLEQQKSQYYEEITL